MEFLRQKVTQTAANAFTQVAIATPTSKTENMAMLIHSIELEPTRHVDSTPTEADRISMTVAKTSQASDLEISDPDCLAMMRINTRLAAIYHDTIYIGRQNHKFDPPILYPKAFLYCSVGATGMASAIIGHFRIGYTLEKVSREDFISALVE